MKYIHMSAGQWALVYNEHYCMGEDGVVGEIEELAYLDRAFDSYDTTLSRFLIEEVQHVMPKTFKTVRKVYFGRFSRSSVIAVADTKGQIEALREKLISIGFEADAAIELERKRRLSAFEAKTRQAALKKIHQSLPHIFGR